MALITHITNAREEICTEASPGDAGNHAKKIQHCYQKRCTKICINKWGNKSKSKTKSLQLWLCSISKKKETFQKANKQSFNDEVFEIASTPKLNPPTYTLFDSSKEIIQGKFYKPEVQLVRESSKQKSRNGFEHEFTVQDISSSSMEIFQENTMAKFRNFFNDKINLSGLWRVALSELSFSTKIEHIINGDLIAFSLRGYQGISEPGNWVCCHFITLQWRKF